MCNICPSGRYSGGGLSSCNMCTAGRYSSEHEARDYTACIYCPLGRYSDLGASSCTNCPVGKASSAVGAYFCADYTAGKYTSAPGQFMCADCALGTYANNGAPVSCSACPGGKSGSAVLREHLPIRLRPLLHRRRLQMLLPGALHEVRSGKERNTRRRCAVYHRSNVVNIFLPRNSRRSSQPPHHRGLRRPLPQGLGS